MSTSVVRLNWSNKHMNKYTTESLCNKFTRKERGKESTHNLRTWTAIVERVKLCLLIILWLDLKFNLLFFYSIIITMNIIKLCRAFDRLRLKIM